MAGVVQFAESDVRGAESHYWIGTHDQKFKVPRTNLNPTPD